MNQLDLSAKKAKNNLLTMFIVLTILDIILVIVSRDMWAIGRIIVTIAVMYFVLQGHKWAKWVLIGIFSLVVFVLIALIAALYSKLSTFLIVGSLIMIFLCVITGIFMTRSQDLNRYFSYKRQAYIKNN